MRALLKTFAVSAIALAAGAIASTANAAGFIEVATSGLAGQNQITWHGTGPGAGHLFATNLMTVLNFNDSLVNDGLFGQAALFTLDATTAPGAVLDLSSAPTFQQQGLNGYFEFRSLDHTKVLLRGDFTGMWLNGRLGDTSGTLKTMLTGGSLNLSSGIVDLSFVKGDNASFGFTNVHPAYSATGGELNDFRGNSLQGDFGGVVPEPATWALMILGFGGAGAMLRSQRRRLAALA